MNTEPVVSVVIPARNEALAISSSLDAVLAQTYPRCRIEVVVVVGAAIDNTAEVASKVLADAGVARWAVLDNPNGTTPSNLNLGLAWAEGDLIVRVDARSLIPSNYIACCVAAMAIEGRSVVGGSQVAIERSDHWRDRAITRALNHRFGMGGSRYRRAGAESGPTDTVYLGVFHRDQLSEAGGWNEEFTTNQDFELNRRMATRGEVWFEADLPVSYLPRSSLREIAQQYHRFGRWKARYWRTTSDRPRPRQLVLIAIPSGLLMASVILVTSAGPMTMAAVVPLVLAGSVAIDSVGGDRPPEPPFVLVVAGATNVLIAASWWSGVVRGLLSPTRRS